ncbi:MAG: hypothetical protein ACLUNQ_07575 [Oscillospiraceae bacterium]
MRRCCCCFSAGSFLGLFANETEVIDAGMQRLRIMGFSYGVSPLMDASIAASAASGKSIRPHGDRHSGVLRVPGHLGLHRVRLAAHHHLPVSAVYLLLDHHRRRRDRLFPPQL